VKICTTVTGELLFTVDRLNPTFLGRMTESLLCKQWTALLPSKLSRPQNRPDSELNHTQDTHTYYSSRPHLRNIKNVVVLGCK